MHLSVWGTWVWPLVWEDPTCLWATEPMFRNKRRHHSEKPAHRSWREAPLTTARENASEQRRSSTAKNQPINKVVFKKDIRQRDMCTVRKPHEGWRKRSKKRAWSQWMSKSGQWEAWGILPHNSQKPPTLMTRWFQASSLQNDERVNFCYLSHPASGPLLRQPQQMSMCPHRLWEPPLMWLPPHWPLTPQVPFAPAPPNSALGFFTSAGHPDSS